MMKLRLHQDIFSVYNIKKTKVLYEGLCIITIKDALPYWLLEFDKCKYDETETVQAFENYLIGMENSK